MRVLVTGATGFVGSHTAVALEDAGHEVRCLVRDPAKLARVFAAHGRDAPESLTGDIGDAARVKEALGGCDAVVHAAAVVAMKASRAQEVLETNARGVENVVGGAVDAGLRRVVHVSSIAAMFVPEGPEITEDDPVQPAMNAYARSKSEAEVYARRLQAEGAPLRITYPTSVLGPFDPNLSEANHALRTFARDVVLLMPGTFAIVDVRDLARIHVALLEQEGAPSRVVANGANLSWTDIADTVDAATGARVRRVRALPSLVRLGGRLCDLVKRVWDFDFPMTKEGMVFATQFNGTRSRRVQDELGIEYRPPVETFGDALAWMHRAGHIDARFVGRLASEEDGA